MATIADIAGNARKYLRDFGTFFETDFASVSVPVLRMPHPLVSSAALDITDISTSATLTVTTDYTVNERIGLVKLVGNPATYAAGLHISGIFYQWFLDEDLTFFAQIMALEHGYHTAGFSLADLHGPEIEIISIGTLIQALWSLTTEFATDIDVSTPEGISIPAHQRFNQVYQLVQYWQAQYDQKAAMLNVGLNKLEVLNLRRISRLTNRYPPMYRGREIDDPRPPVRVFPPIDIITPTPFEAEEEYWETNYGDPSEVIDIGDGGGWFSIGSNGGV